MSDFLNLYNAMMRTTPDTIGHLKAFVGNPANQKQMTDDQKKEIKDKLAELTDGATAEKPKLNQPMNSLNSGRPSGIQPTIQKDNSDELARLKRENYTLNHNFEMVDIENKMLEKEILELKKRLSQYEMNDIDADMHAKKRDITIGKLKETVSKLQNRVDYLMKKIKRLNPAEFEV